MPAIAVALLALGANLSGDAVADATGRADERAARVRREAARRHGASSCSCSRRSSSSCRSSAASTPSTPTWAPTPRQAAIAKESAMLGYNKPVLDQYFHYVRGLLHGNLEDSLRTRRPVSTDMATYLPGHHRAGHRGAGDRGRAGGRARPGLGRPLARRRRVPRPHDRRRLGPGLPAGPPRHPLSSTATSTPARPAGTPVWPTRRPGPRA